MRKETIITAIVFFGVGFLSGYIYDSHQKSNAQQEMVLAGAPSSQQEATPQDSPGATPDGPTAAANSSGLPEGHPPIDTAVLAKAFEDQAAQNPNDPGPPLKMANLLYDHKQYAKAVPWYRRALALDPHNISARTDLGTAYFYIGRPAEALREYRKSLETDPQHEPTLYNIIVISLDGTHDLRGAREAWDRLHKLNPNYPGLESLKQRLDAARASEGNSGTPR